MKPIHQLLAAVACSVPLIAIAQTASSPAVKPADQPRTQLERDQTTQNGQATKYGGPGTDTGGNAGSTSGMTDDHASGKGMKHKAPAKSGQTATGDVPTYPAPAKDGTPTK